MSKSTSGAQEQPQNGDIGPVAFQLSLDEFCLRLSQTERRVEMIGAFHHTEKKAKRVRDTEAAFKARFTAFCNAPA